MRYAGIVDNDIANGSTGVCVSFWTQGCPHRCKGCHNPETWDFDGGEDLPDNYLNLLFEKLEANGISRSLSILGGEPLCNENKHLVYNVVKAVKEKKPSTNIYLWTGYVIEDLIAEKDPEMDYILKNLYMLVDGPFILELRDTRLELRGSSNQRVLYNRDILEKFATN